MGTEEVEEADPWENYSGSKDSTEGGEGEDEDEAEKDFPEVAGECALALSVALLQV